MYLSHKYLKNSQPVSERIRTGEIKGRGCADGRKQWENMSKEENSAQTVSIEAVMLSCVIDAMEKRDVCLIFLGHSCRQK